MESKLIINCQNLGYYSDFFVGNSSKEKWDIIDLNLKIYSYDRVRFIFKNKDQRHVLLRLFLKKLKPKTGSILIHSKINIYTGNDFLERADEKLSIVKNFKSRLFSKRPWIGGKRKSLETLIDRLNLGGHTQYLPLYRLSFEQRTRLKILMLISAKTKIILIENLFLELDEISFLLFEEWLNSFIGSVIFFDDHNLKNDSKKNKNILIHQKIKKKFRKIVRFSENGLARYNF